MPQFFQDVGVTVGDFVGYATDASLSGSQSFQAVRAVGFKGSIGTVPSGPPGGSASFSFTGSSPGAGDFLTDDPENDEVDVKVGSANGKGLCDSFSISCEPNALASSTLSFMFFKPPTIALGAGAGGGASADVGKSLLHGAGAGSAGGQSVEYSMSQSFEGIYELGSFCPIYKYRSDAEETGTVQGDDIGSAIKECADAGCATEGSVTISIGAICSGGTPFTANVEGYITEQGVTVSEGGVLSGKLVVVNYF